MTKTQAKKYMEKLEEKGIVTLTREKGVYTRDADVKKMEKMRFSFNKFIKASHVLGEL
jgi:DNA-binding transcriptional regulator YhcF (GntR family)